MNLNQTERRVLDLLRAALGGKETEAALFAGMDAAEWQDCYRLAARQGVMALAWDGVCTLPLELRPPKSLRLNWAMAVEKYERQYQRYCHTIAELSEYYAGQGISTVQMKGVGLSTYYPNPAHREGGDIDIFTWSADPARMTDAEANRRANTLMEEQGIEVDYERTEKHSVFYYKGIPIENHKTFVNSEIYPVAVGVDAWLRQNLRPVRVELATGDSIQIPSPEFNMIFVAFHAAQHYTHGLVLHHLCDWACLLNRLGLRIPEEIGDKRFRRFMLALTALCDTWLGTSVGVRADKGLMDEILSEILRPPYAKTIPVEGKWAIVAYKAKRLWHIGRLSNKVLYLSWTKRIGRSVWLHLRRPRTVFLRG